jgi:pyrroline-5-carboxylate reductase
MTRLALLGGGRMGEALLAGLLDAGFTADALAVAEVDPERRRQLELRFPAVRVVPSAAWAVPDADVVVLAVKPGDLVDVAESIVSVLAAHTLVVSIAAGVTLTTIEAALPGRPVVRAMPNTPALVRQGAAGIAGGTHATEADLDTAARVLGAVGVVVRVPEHQLDAVTGLSGSGPAYVFLVAEAMIEAGVLVGLSRDAASQLVRETLLGSARLLAEGTDTPETLRAAVTSPGGTTAAGLQALEHHGVRAAFLDAVQAATARSRELGRRETDSSA